MIMPSERLEIVSHSPEHTGRLGRVLADWAPKGSVIALRGELATGKTCLVRGMAQAFAQEPPVHSPTFTLVNEYGDQHKLYHVDLYRIDDLRALDTLGYEDLFEPDGVCVIEWAERAEAALPLRRLDVFLQHAGENTRRLIFVNRDLLTEGWQQALASLDPLEGQ
ncbi:MAG TPA: tRNA (adenosine(37)-N6)-threonylcarbamoyltransferase complex ATPase subunit type 1 TsaE [Candidatus Hydrogenedentes bacterium]|nr:tRNA (adenosine(37)-N6)-threonylcarbamoyltransferase complex ATPase subunit type 1 TsaE [Candidatus Hydrogenedentota bacterium]HPG66702.1 tRNA (adenosine(37)-N6)-threonylcarbamoyltransferase complex ATPase subunit type 1 TsaE [Candidatus Hydrogenedentota bacterium]